MDLHLVGIFCVPPQKRKKHEIEKRSAVQMHVKKKSNMNRFYHVAPVWLNWCLPCLVSRDRDIKSCGHRRQPWCPIQHPLTMKDHEHWAFDPHQGRSQPHSIPKVLSLSCLGTPFWTAGDLWKKARVVRTGWKKSRSLGCIAISAPSSKSRKALENVQSCSTPAFQSFEAKASCASPRNAAPSSPTNSWP